MGRFVAAAVAFALAGVSSLASAADNIESAIGRSEQLIVVTTRGWNDNKGTLSFHERAADRSWRSVFADVPVMLGRNGLAWGVGLHEQRATKREGDGRSPAGAFELSRIYGRDARAPGRHFPYEQLSADTQGIDDPRSRYYNRVVDAPRVPAHDWRSSEKLRPGNPMFRWIVEVKHNWQQRPGLGSCIYLHIWKGPGVATSGCTAMAEGHLAQIVRRLDARKQPLLVQLPEEEFHANGLGLVLRRKL